MSRESLVRIFQRALSWLVDNAAPQGEAFVSEDAISALCRSSLPWIESWEVTGVISDILPKTVAEVLHSSTFSHSWFRAPVEQSVYRDIWGRIWNKTTGLLRDGVPTAFVSDSYHVDALGGMMWTSSDNDRFVCEYRTNMEEFRARGPKPESFVVA